MQLGIAGKVALVTGSGQGIGQAIARAFAAEGACVVVNDLVAERVAETVQHVEATGAKALGSVADITSYAAVKEMLADVEARIGPVDILVNNAAVLTPKTFVESTPEDWDREIKVILYGTLNCTRAVVEGMIARKQGKIISIASDAARIGQERDTYYGAAKAGVIGFSKSLAKEVGPFNVNVNAVSPSGTDTPMRRDVERRALEHLGEEKYRERERKILRAYPLRRIGQPEDIANMVLFLASDAGRHITGQVISVNGGFCMPG